MATEQLEHLLARMPAIAEAVNAFTSEAVQQQAFRFLVSSLGGADDGSLSGGDSATPSGGSLEGGIGGRAAPSKRRAAAKTPGATDDPSKGSKRRAPVKSPSTLDINFRPAGKTSLSDFIAEKAPTTNDERNVVVVYYFRNELGLPAVTVDHVYTAYREMKGAWKIPANLRNALHVTKSTRNWIDTSDMDDIALTSAGTNTVEHDLPRQKKK